MASGFGITVALKSIHASSHPPRSMEPGKRHDGRMRRVGAAAGQLIALHRRGEVSEEQDEVLRIIGDRTEMACRQRHGEGWGNRVVEGRASGSIAKGDAFTDGRVVGESATNVLGRSVGPG